MKECVIPKDTNATVDEVWNFYTKKKVPNTVVREKSLNKNKGGEVR